MIKEETFEKTLNPDLLNSFDLPIGRVPPKTTKTTKTSPKVFGLFALCVGGSGIGE